MVINEYGQVTITEQEAFQALYNGTIVDLEKVFLDNADAINKFNLNVQDNGDRVSPADILVLPSVSVEEFDKTNQARWFMPDEYKTYDIVDWLYCECRTVEEKERVTEELKLFAQHNMIYLLKYLKYLIDTMRKNNIVWGVGRGSSVASFCLYLMGLHKINSLKYKLDINEFLR